MKQIGLFIAIILISSGCVTIPLPVDEKLLVEKTQDESKIIADLETAIIAKNNEKAGALKAYEASERQYQVDSGRLKILNDEKNLLVDKGKQFVFEGDQTKISENKENQNKKDSEINRQTRQLDYSDASRKNKKAAHEVSEAELSVMVADMNLQKAKVARTYQLKIAGKTGEPPRTGIKALFKKKDEVDVNEYENYLEKQKVILQDKRLKLQETSEKLRIVKENLEVKN